MLHDPGGLSDPVIHNYYSDSNNTSSSSSVPPLSKLPRERKTTTTTMTNHTHRRSSDRAKDLHRLNPPQLIDLVLRLESQLDRTETRLTKYVVRCKEHVESETQASAQANKFRQKITQVILDAQHEAARAKQDVEEYKLRFENVQTELQRSREVVQILENDKDEIQRALHRARDRAREYKEQSAIQLAREQGRRAGFDQGLEQGRFAVQIAQARVVTSALPASSTSRTAPRRRALTQGTDGATTAPTTPIARQRRRQSHQSQSQTQHGRRPSLDSIREEPTSSRPRPRPRPRPPSQTQTDGGRSNASNTGRAPPAQQFPAGAPRDDASEATTSPASTMTGMDILTFREDPIVSTSPTSSPELRRPRGGPTNTTRPVSGPPQQTSHSSPPGITVEPPPPMAQPQPPVVFQQDENLLTPTFLPSHTLPRVTSSNSITLSTRSSFSVEIQIEPPSQPSTPQTDEFSSGQDAGYLSPNGSRPMSLPQVQPQPQIVQPHESPVLPVLPRIVPQPTVYGTPAAVRPLDLAGAGYEVADTPPGFEYPLPLGAVSGQNVGNGKGKSVAPAGGGASSSSYYAAGPYVSSTQSVIPPVTPKAPSSPSSSSSSSSSPSPSASSSSQPPVVPPVVPIYQQPQGPRNGYHRNRGSDEEAEEDTSFDSATKRNTELNSRLSRKGKWGGD